MVSYQSAATVPGEQTDLVIYDATSGEPVAVLGPPTYGFSGFSGEITITAICFAALSAGTPCSRFDAAAPDGTSD
jgi:hypothetical protein